MSGSFLEALESGRFLVTTEESPPKGADLTTFLARTELLRGLVDAVAVTESSSAVMTMSPIGTMPGLLEQGHEPILQITCRDRNRIALQGDLLAAAALGVRSIAVMAGDPIEGGDQPGAKGVFDLDSVALLETVRLMNAGRDSTGHTLRGAPSFCCGAVVNPGAEDIEAEIAHMQRKADAGARFFFSQAVYEVDVFERFIERATRVGVPVIASYIVPKSGDMARRLNRSLGISIPTELIEALDATDDRAATSIELSGQILSKLAPMCRGVHLIAVGWEQHFGALLAASGISKAVGQP